MHRKHVIERCQPDGRDRAGRVEKHDQLHDARLQTGRRSRRYRLACYRMIIRIPHIVCEQRRRVRNQRRGRRRVDNRPHVGRRAERVQVLVQQHSNALLHADQRHAYTGLAGERVIQMCLASITPSRTI